MTKLLIVYLLGVVSVDVTTVGGSHVRGELAKLTKNEVGVLTTSGREQSVSRDDLREIMFGETSSVATPPAMRVYLSDQSVVPADRLVVDDQAVDLNSSTLKVSEIQSRHIRAARWGEVLPGDGKSWEAIMKLQTTEDLLVIRRGENLDYLKGAVLSLTKAKLAFSYNGREISVPLDKSEGVVFANRADDQRQPQMQLELHSGDLLRLRSVSLQADGFHFETLAGMIGRVATGEVQRMTFAQLGATYLSNLKPTEIRYEPLVSSTILASLKKLRAPRFNLSFDGLPIRIRQGNHLQEFQHGIALQSKTEVVYRLAGKYSRFFATAGIDPDLVVSTNPEVELILKADDRPILQRTISRQDGAIPIEVDVVGAQRLKIVVDYGGNLHIGDRLHLADARVVQ